MKQKQIIALVSATALVATALAGCGKTSEENTQTTAVSEVEGTAKEDLPFSKYAETVTVTAGIPITAIEEITDYISFQPARHYSNPLFALKVRGESMINAAILDGDMVVIEQTPYAENGDIVCALVDNESATIKTFYKEDGHYRLQPENDTMDPIIVDEVSILGKVVGVVRYL